MRIKIIYDRSGCIGAAACQAVAPDFWKIVDDGLADLKGASKVPGEEGVYELLIDESEAKEHFKRILQENKEAAEACPVQVIKIINLDTGEKIV